ncbi:hypothetical protein J0S82_019748 [Galemys pyrenaicus]|uniref:Uncharacterized protein n=1 Tax=Galemys pyrenaicus TaxID=202257 RepID=A0A8J5ZUV2_GALPY|nr:hypothetical protein J0S82_019748 [Galemys pyrenaicus]
MRLGWDSSSVDLLQEVKPFPNNQHEGSRGWCDSSCSNQTNISLLTSEAGVILDQRPKLGYLAFQLKALHYSAFHPRSA